MAARRQLMDWLARETNGRGRRQPNGTESLRLAVVPWATAMRGSRVAAPMQSDGRRR